MTSIKRLLNSHILRWPAPKLTSSQAAPIPDQPRLRILFYNHTGLTSGAERVLLNTLAGLDRALFDPLAACPPEGDLTGLLNAQGVPALTAPSLEARFTSNPLLLLRYLLSFAAAILNLRSLIAGAAPDVVHANSVRAGIVATLATVFTSTPIVWHVHDDLPAHPISTAIRLAAFLSPRTTLLAVSNATAKAFSGRLPFGDRVHVLYNGIELTRYPAKTSTASPFRTEIGLQPDDFLLTAVGMINPRKGLATLLDAFKIVIGGNPNIHLAIVGAPIFNRDDLHLAALKQQATRLGLDARVHFTGPRKDIAEVLRASDLLVLNATVEPFGLVLVEAMSSGTPVLATRVGGIPEIITDNQFLPATRTGFLVPPAHPNALAARILEIAADPITRARVAAAAITQVCLRFSQQRYNRDFATFYRTRFSSLKTVILSEAEEPTVALAVVFPTPAPNFSSSRPERSAVERPPHFASAVACPPPHPHQSVILSEAEGPAFALASAAPPALKIKAALFHDNFAQNGGAERVAEELHRALRATFPSTDLHSTLSAEERLSPYLRSTPIHTTWMQWLPARAKLFRAYFLLYPLAVDHADLSAYDLILTSCFGYAKGVKRSPGSLHICYCHTPMRWVWRTQDYLSREQNSRLKTAALALPLRWLKSWELRAATRPDLYLANSQVVADRLFQAFGVHASVIPPPIDTTRFAPAPGPIQDPDDFYLVLSRLVPYKRFDLAVQACTQSNRRLVVIGEGPDRARLEALAGPTVTFLGRAPDSVVTDHARRCRALLFPGEEDFGMTPLEVNAAGRPVVAFRAGGATETILPGLNGVFFDQSTPDSLLAAITQLEAHTWDSAAIRRHAQSYDTTVFHTRILNFVEQALALRDRITVRATTPAKAAALATKPKSKPSRAPAWTRA